MMFVKNKEVILLYQKSLIQSNILEDFIRSLYTCDFLRVLSCDYTGTIIINTCLYIDNFMVCLDFVVSTPEGFSNFYNLIRNVREFIIKNSIEKVDYEKEQKEFDPKWFEVEYDHRFLIVNFNPEYNDFSFDIYSYEPEDVDPCTFAEPILSPIILILVYKSSVGTFYYF